MPSKLLTDNGPEFSSSDFIRFVRLWGLSSIMYTTLSPSNGAVERMHRIIRNILRSLTVNCIDFEAHLPKAVIVYNNVQSELSMHLPNFY